jgi:predicted  nucleic acid-binding Zn-ribbon protein
MSTHPHHRRDGRAAGPGIRAAPSLFARANAFLDLVWEASELGACMTPGCTDCGALEFRRMLATADGLPPDVPLSLHARMQPAPDRVASALAELDFDLLRLAPRWYDALDSALFHVRDRGRLAGVLESWVRRDAVPTRVLDLVLFRHARYGHPDERVADLWIDRCLEASADTGDEGLVESLILACPERVGADPRALRAALDASRRSSCVRDIIGRIGDCA